MTVQRKWLTGIILASMILTTWGKSAFDATAQAGQGANLSSTPLAETRQAHPLADSIIIDGVFSGELLDGDGAYSDGPGPSAQPGQFIELKKFDAADCVSYHDLNENERADAEDAYWLDIECNNNFNPLTDGIILNAPRAGVPGVIVDYLDGITYLAYNDTEIEDNNRYDNSEDIYFVDNQQEFLGATERIIYDPLTPDNKRALAHLYMISDAGTTYVHNDFLIDDEALWIDSNGIETAGRGQQEYIGLPPFNNAISDTQSVEIFGHWFSTADNLYWLSTAPYSDTWNTSGDALWLDYDDDGIFNPDVDRFVVDTSETLSGSIGLEIGSDGPNPIYNFAYNDEDQDGVWDDGEDIFTLDGDESYDWSYFFDRWSWLADGDGYASSGPGDEGPAILDGNTWFQASDRVFHNDANANRDWDAGEALWIDHDGNGIYNSSIDQMLVMSGTVSNGTTGDLLWVQLVDGDGVTSPGNGGEYVPRRGQTPFQLEDNMLWHDVDDDDARFWSQGDGLWLDADGNDLYDAGTDQVIVRGSMQDGDRGTRLSPGALHFGYDDGEIALNGRYDPGEDIYAANTFLAYDDFEVDFNGVYDSGEDIYYRTYVEVWVYANDESDHIPTDIYKPDLEPGLHDEGLQVHLNGARIDDPEDDFDTPLEFQAAAGWGPSRGAVAAGSRPTNAYNRHYEYKFSAPYDGDGHLFSQWQSLRRGANVYQGFASSAMLRAETIMQDWLDPMSPPPVTAPLVLNHAIAGAITMPHPLSTYLSDPYCWSIAVSNPGDEAIGALVLTDTLPSEWIGTTVVYAPGTDYEIVENPQGPTVSFPHGLAAKAQATIAICAGGPIDLETDEVSNLIEGVFDHDSSAGTPMVSIPTPLEYLIARVPILRDYEGQLFKAAMRPEVPANWRVTWRIGAANTGERALSNVALYDDVPDELRARTQNQTAAPGGDVDINVGAMIPGQIYIVNLETEVAAGITPSTTLTNSVTLSADIIVSQTMQLPYVLTTADNVHVTEPRTLMPPPPYITLSTADGPDIPDFALEALLDAYVPDYHSMLLIFTQCFGGDLLEALAERENTGILSANAPGYCAHYLGYDDAVAAALYPAAGRTSDDVHQSGIAGKHDGETPQQTGINVSLEPATAGGSISGRQVFVYAAEQFGGINYEEQQRTTILNNFAGGIDTAVTAIGGAGSAGWDYPGTLAGFRDALAGIQGQMNATKQFILYVTGPGDYHAAARALELPPRVTATALVTVPVQVLRSMHQTGSNNDSTGVTLYAPGVVTFTAGSLAIHAPFDATPYTTFVTQRLDINGDGSYDGVGEGTYLFFAVPEIALIPPASDHDAQVEIDIENLTFETLTFAYASLDSGNLFKRLPNNIYMPFCARNAQP